MSHGLSHLKMQQLDLHKDIESDKFEVNDKGRNVLAAAFCSEPSDWKDFYCKCCSQAEWVEGFLHNLS